jgi:hypothetical protein
MKKSEFNKLLEQQDFTGATELLKRALQQARIINPRQDETWAPPADHLGYALLEEQGIEPYQEYWIDLLNFFEKELEKDWGHIHKGHIYFRLGFAYLGSDLVKAKEILRQSVSEDTSFERKYQQQLGIQIPLEEALVRFPSFVFVRFLDLIRDAEILVDQERQTFFRGLVPTHWDVIWGPKPVDERLVRSAIRVIVSEKVLEKAYEIFDKIQIDFAARNGIDLIGSTKFLLETLLYDQLHNQMRIDSIAAKDIRKAELGALLSEFWRRQTISSDSIWAVFQCVNLLSLNFTRFGTEEEQNSGLATAMAVGTKILLDMALVDWVKIRRN